MSTSVVHVSLLAIAMTAGLIPPGLQEPSQRAVALDADRVVERHLDRGEIQRYQLTLQAGECARVLVEQRGVDVVIQAIDPDGTPIAEFQSELRSQGEERVEVVAVKAGAYILAVKPSDGLLVDPDASYAISLIDIHAATEADRTLQQARTLHVEAIRLDKTAKFTDARAQLERILTLVTAVRGDADDAVGMTLFELGGVALEQHDDAAAEQFFQRSLAVLDKTRGADNPASAMAKSRIALVYRRAGRLPESLALLEPATAAVERSLGPTHPWFVRCLVTLGSLQDDLHDFDAAEATDRRALGILDRLQQHDTIAYADLLNNVGLIEREKHDYVRAQEDLARSVTLGEQLRGPNSLYVSNGLQNLGMVAHDRKDNAAAERYYQRALEIRQALVGPDHPDVAQLLNNLGNIYQANGDTPRALEMHFRALHICEKTPYQPRLLGPLGNIARIYAASGDLANAVTFQRRADALVERQLQLNLMIGSERQKLALTSGTAGRTDRTVSLHLLQASSNPEAASLAALVLLQRKGRVLDAMSDTLATVRQHLTDSADRQLLDDLRRTTADLARTALSPSTTGSAEEQTRQIDALAARQERLEADLSAHSGAFRAQAQPVTLEAVQAALPDNAALVEFAVFRPFDPKVDGDEAYGATHYAAYLVRKLGVPQGMDLGPAAAIDSAIDELRQSLRDPRDASAKARARTVDQRVMQPLRTAMGGATQLLISPDGNLHLVPFEALVDEQGRFLIERYAIGYLTSGRDLLRMQVLRASRSDPVIVADPLFGEPTTSVAPARTQIAVHRRARNRSVTAGDNLATLYFAPLLATAGEAQAIKVLFPSSTVLLGSNASKAQLTRVEAPIILHIASHGFFLGEADAKIENPLLRSGLALAGANRSHDPRDDGILTALEASSLNLWGTKLVTLSACDTGVGEVRNGEGVYGLRRAFVLAGAETLVTSLWPISDYVAREMMIAYYTGLRDGLGRGEALRHAKLAMLTRKSRQHPFYWASFVQSGEWASLDGHR